MKPRRSILREALLFLSVGIAALILGIFFITDWAARSSLEDLFRQRFDQSNKVLAKYTESRHLARSKELENVLSSPRFLAAVETADPETIARELPTYAALLGSDAVFIRGLQGGVLPVQHSTPADLYDFIVHELGTWRESVEIRQQGTSLGFAEIAFAPIRANNGTALGQLASLTHVGSSTARDLSALTGFDVLLFVNEAMVGTSAEAPPAFFGELGKSPSPRGEITHVRHHGEEFLIQHIEEPVTGLTVVFLGSVDEAIRPLVMRTRLLLAVLALTFGSIALFVLWWFAKRRVVTQVRHLVESAERIARADLDFTIRPASEDEFGLLATAMETMRAELKSGREALEVAHRERLNSERMASLGRIAAGIIHDFKSPMAVIRGTAELIERKEAANPKLVKQCASIQHHVDRMTSMTRDVLEYSSGKSVLEVATVDIRDYLEELISFHREAYERDGIRLEFECKAGHWFRLDPGRMRRVIDNLLVNAREACRVGDLVAIRATSQPGVGLTICIEDSGPGIPPHLLETLFEPFVTSGKESGTGLGLAIARKIVQDHGALIDVCNREDRGARFTLALPEKLRTNEPTETPQEALR